MGVEITRKESLRAEGGAGGVAGDATNKKSVSPLTSGEATDPKHFNCLRPCTLSLLPSLLYIKVMVPFTRGLFPGMNIKASELR